ncbi:MAG: CPXCG motif-containing cysteine-rich protein [Pseudomonadota bacterium]|nr:CPXCG motif-containing cysteine-rich protein [Pseudomonadota bacterium]
MGTLEEVEVGCPYCGEAIEVLIDASEPEQKYIEDCQVCCRPIVFKVAMTPTGAPEVGVYSEDDVI